MGLKQATTVHVIPNAMPHSEVERVADSVTVEVMAHNGVVLHCVSLYEVLKYPSAFDLKTLKVL